MLPAFMGNKKRKAKAIRCLGLLLFVLERSQSLRARMPASWSGCTDGRTDEAQTLLRVGLDRHRGRDARTEAEAGQPRSRVRRIESYLSHSSIPSTGSGGAWNSGPSSTTTATGEWGGGLIASHRIEIAKRSRLDSFVRLQHGKMELLFPGLGLAWQQSFS